MVAGSRAATAEPRVLAPDRPHPLRVVPLRGRRPWPDASRERACQRRPGL